MLRSDVRKRLLEKGAALTVILSDTCNVNGHAKLNSVGAGAPEKLVPNKILNDLIHRHDGVIDVNGASPNQFGWYSPDTGGWFTDQFISGIHSHDLTGLEFVSWKDYMSWVEKNLDRFYHSSRTRLLERPAALNAETAQRLEQQSDQTPAVFVNHVMPRKP